MKSESLEELPLSLRVDAEMAIVPEKFLRVVHKFNAKLWFLNDDQLKAALTDDQVLAYDEAVSAVGVF